ncbi:MAG TPA: ATP-binding protein, partial [Longimicrobium sp.]|nr:ATP-binding protein [Longimicrobium sp.]
ARAEEALALLDSLFRGAPIGLAFLDPELRYVAINDALARSNGLPADAHLGRTVEEIIPVFAPIVEPILRRVLETGEPVVDWEWTGASIDRPEETRHWLESFYPVLGEEGRVLGVGVALTEITEIKRAEDVQRFLAETSRLVAPMLDRAGWLEQLPRSALPRLGDYCVLDLADEAGEVRATVLAHVDPEKEALAREFRRLFPLDARKSDFAVLRVLRTGEPVIALEVPAGYVDETVDDEASRALLRQLAPNTFLVLPLSARGRVLGTMSFVMSEPGRRHTPRDVALAEELVRRIAMAIDNARLYEAERRARAEAEAANRAKFDFLTTMSHELRTPLNAIAGYVELLELGIHGPVTEAQTDALRRIQRNQRHLLGLINDVLNFARLETGSLPLRLEAVDVGEALAGLEPLVAPQLAARALRYACVSPPAPLAARADPERMQQVLLNLLSNAVKFTEPGGRVRVEAARGEDGRTVEIRVRDTGIGIPPEKREEVFEPFVQLDRGLTRTTEGTGLGLAISRDLARAMGGDLVAGENPGGGAVFTLTLPIA